MNCNNKTHQKYIGVSFSSKKRKCLLCEGETIPPCPICGKMPTRTCWGTGASLACPDGWGRKELITCSMKQTKIYFQKDLGDGNTIDSMALALAITDWKELCKIYSIKEES